MRCVQWAMLAAGLAMAVGAGPQAGAQTPFRPVATVNESLITAFDVDQRARMMAMLGAQAESEQALASMALDRLIEDRLKLEAAEDVGLEPTSEIVEQGVATMAGQVGVSPQEFRARLAEQGITEQAITDMVASQMLWREVVRERFRGRIEFGEAEIDAEIALAAEGRASRLRLQEIGLPLEGSGRTPEETRALADRLYRELSAGGDFAAAVRRHSRAPSVENGGNVGWVDAADLPPRLASVLARVEPGAVAPPQEVQGGITLLRVLERERVAAEEADPQDPELRERVRRELTSRRLELLAQGLIQELRRDAMIELR
jgi:peptidyl-prolyl cis-trans isomerase SurA